MRLLQHVPASVDGVEPKIATGTLAEILAAPWVAQWLEQCAGGRFMVSGTTLMVDGQRDGVRWWWVVGFFDESPSELPEWAADAGAARREEPQ